MMKRKDLENDCVLVRPEAKSMKTDSSDKEKKYDRQLRLWGDNGQNALENAHVCLLNATATGVELLKSLVLPGIGKYTIIDDAVVSEEDLGSNFFLTPQCIGKPRAESSCSLLQDLNANCKGSFVIVSPLSIVENDPHALRQFDVVISSRIGIDPLGKLSRFLWEHKIPHVTCETYGFFGHLRVDIEEHVAIETHPDNALPDLRLQRPFPSLLDFMERFDLESLNHHDHGHVPYLVIIYKALLRWQADTESVWPKSYKEKTAIKDIIQSWVWKSDEGVPENEENFEEALRNANNILAQSTISREVAQILEASKQLAAKTQNVKFWIIANAVQQFIETSNDGWLPLQGSIPDMFCDSCTFIQLQKLYKSKADDDAQAVHTRAIALAVKSGYASDHVTFEDVKLFCKNASCLSVSHGRPLFKELEHDNASELCNYLADDDDVMPSLYVLSRAICVFHSRHGRFPGSDVPDVSNDDEGNLRTIVDSVQRELHLTAKVNPDLIAEVCRWGCAEVHSIASVMAAAAAHEVIKIITKQYIPVDNILLYNGISQETVTMKL